MLSPEGRNDDAIHNTHYNQALIMLIRLIMDQRLLNFG
jgi:hypothetical protein